MIITANVPQLLSLCIACIGLGVLIGFAIGIHERESGDKEYYEKNDTVESTYSFIYHGTPISDNATVCDIEQIRAEINELSKTHNPAHDPFDGGYYKALWDVKEIIDKYTKGENK